MNCWLTRVNQLSASAGASLLSHVWIKLPVEATGVLVPGDLYFTQYCDLPQATLYSSTGHTGSWHIQAAEISTLYSGMVGTVET